MSLHRDQRAPLGGLTVRRSRRAVNSLPNRPYFTGALGRCERAPGQAARPPRAPREGGGGGIDTLLGASKADLAHGVGARVRLDAFGNSRRRRGDRRAACRACPGRIRALQALVPGDGEVEHRSAYVAPRLVLGLERLEPRQHGEVLRGLGVLLVRLAAERLHFSRSLRRRKNSAFWKFVAASSTACTCACSSGVAPPQGDRPRRCMYWSRRWGR